MVSRYGECAQICPASTTSKATSQSVTGLKPGRVYRFRVAVAMEDDSTYGPQRGPWSPNSAAIKTVGGSADSEDVAHTVVETRGRITTQRQERIIERESQIWLWERRRERSEREQRAQDHQRVDMVEVWQNEEQRRWERCLPSPCEVTPLQEQDPDETHE